MDFNLSCEGPLFNLQTHSVEEYHVVFMYCTLLDWRNIQPDLNDHMQHITPLSVVNHINHCYFGPISTPCNLVVDLFIHLAPSLSL